MGFWKKHWEKITADTISGILIRFGALVLLGGGAYVGIKNFSQPVDNGTTKELIGLIHYIIITFSVFLILKLSEILIWLSERRKDRIKEQELKNDNLKMENENLKLQLELRQQEQESQRDDGE